MKYVTPVFDRTLDDITNRTTKAFFNIADWTRISGNAEAVNILVNFLSKTSIVFNPVTNQLITSIPTAAELNTLLANIERIRVTCSLPAITGLVEIKDDWVAGRTADAPDYETVNDWERVLDILLSANIESADYRVYCGVSNAGQPRFYQHQFRQYAFVQPSSSPVRRSRTQNAIAGAGLTRNNGFRRYE
ncbi:MAG: hypothetical protein JZU60_02170 [Ilumatobacteraceae bacterium]|jgi:hypothetical protein|nr:hypothetical protein [Ilumatobacteraceae bacterium]